MKKISVFLILMLGFSVFSDVASNFTDVRTPAITDFRFNIFKANNSDLKKVKINNELFRDDLSELHEKYYSMKRLNNLIEGDKILNKMALAAH